MGKELELIDYSNVTECLGTGRCHLLLGNGFSIACDKRFSYGSLYEYACENGLSEHAKSVFEYMGTNNFEGVLRLLKDGYWIASHYGYRKKPSSNASMRADMKAVKKSLLSAVAKTHPHNPLALGEEKLENCVSFLSNYHNVFTLNYDLLLYWVSMRGSDEMMRRDGFGNSMEDPDADYCVFNEHIKEKKGIFFIHGGLHLYVTEGEVRKHTWSKTGTPLIELITESLSRAQYPLFVAEGSAQKKKIQIQRDSYLSYCLGKFQRIEKSLVIFGLSLGPSDEHIIDSIVRNRKLQTLFVGLFGKIDSPTNQSIIRICKKMKNDRDSFTRNDSFAIPLDVNYYDSSTAPVWRGRLADRK